MPKLIIPIKLHIALSVGLFLMTVANQPPSDIIFILGIWNAGLFAAVNVLAPVGKYALRVFKDFERLRLIKLLKAGAISADEYEQRAARLK